MISNENACAEVKEKGISWLAGRIKGSSVWGCVLQAEKLGALQTEERTGEKSQTSERWYVFEKSQQFSNAGT